jgi:RNA 3'-terminal phosphate cyclase (ATP)
MEEGARNRLARAGFGEFTTEFLQDGSPNRNTGVPIDIQVKRERNEDVMGGGSGIVLWAELGGGGVVGGSAVGKKGIAADVVGQQAADELVKGLEGGGCVDEWLQDQIIIFMALAEGQSGVRCAELTLHTR